MGWALEIGKMALYLAFPVGMFHYVNHSESAQREIFIEKRKQEQRENTVDAAVADSIMRDLAAGKLDANIDQFEELRAKARAKLLNETAIN